MSGILLNVVGGSFATVPGAPTIGAATPTGPTTATVAFTAPASDGGSVITSYTATSSPSSITGTLSQAGSGTIIVTGLATGTAYTFTVTATNAIGTSVASAASNSVTPVLSIGDAYEGGFFAGQIGVSSVATHNLVVAPLSSGETTALWKNVNTTTIGAKSVIDGPQNTVDMVTYGNSTVYPCAHFCNDAVIGGFSDWYMPAQNELEICYFNLKPSTDSNDNSSGINPNAVPARASNYTGGSPATNPAQTSAAAFQTGGAEAFEGQSYWSSTEFSSVNARSQVLSYGYQSTTSYKGTSRRVRCVRRVSV